ncbi:MAG: bifunctional YncE family protein/alkaline phosphatase family protein [Acidimicrobiales bacterium]
MAVAAQRHSEDRPTGPGLGQNAERFLEVTGDVEGGEAVLPSAAAAAAGSEEEDAAPIEGNYTPNGFRIRPAGAQVGVFSFPLGLTATHDASQVIVSGDSGGMQGLTTIDADGLTATHTPAANLFVGLAATPDGRVYASGGNADRVFRLRLAGPTLVHEDLTEAAMVPNHNAVNGITDRAGLPELPAGNGITVPGYPGASVLDGDLLYVAGTLSEPSGSGADACPSGQPVCGRVSVIDTTTDTVIRRIPVGLDAYALALDADHHRLYVANWADEAGRGDGKGTVSIVDISAPVTAHEIGYVAAGHHPSALALRSDPDRLFVANTNDDTISVFDLDASAGLVLAGVESVAPQSGVPVGAHPDAFALSPDGSTLFVALAGLNAVEVRDGVTGARMGGMPTYIPTGWYPSALLVTGTPGDYRLWVTNAKGAGAARGTGTGVNLSIGGDGNQLAGTVSVIDLPAPDQEAAWTEQVVENDGLDEFKVDPCRPPAGIEPSEVLCPPRGKHSPIKHVVYIVTENKTFDQYFGDLDPATYDADPTYLLYGETVTPNHHAMADRYGLSDRFFSDAQVSVTGHSWTSGAIATDHNEKTFQADYDQGIRGNHGNGDPLRPGVGGETEAKEINEAEDELDDPEGGYIFEAFKRAGAVPPLVAPPAHKRPPLSMAIYGESTALESGDMGAYKAPGWKDGDIQYFDTCRAHQFIDGVAPDGPIVPGSAPDQFKDCEGRTLPPQFTLAHWTDVFNSSGAHPDVMPSFIYMSLPVNHTLGTNLGSPTPASMVADNDYAIGLITEALSHSPFWESTVIVQTEDDTQAAGDHISPLRDYLQVSGPWAKPGANHQWGSMPSLLRTIEQIFGVRPISLFDRLALPQHGAFRSRLSDEPDLTPYKAVVPAVPFALNEPGAVGQAESASMDFSTYDLIDEDLLNAILYAEARGVPLDLPER